MSGVTFDPDARTEFLAAIEYYEESRPGLGYRFRLIVESAVHSINENPFCYDLLNHQ
jgi:hypothetical protein